jgi:glycosyltransferase involved in cell wall biosynthesis
VVIPALNEAERLHVLLDALAHQTCPPHQVVVADAGSTDATRKLSEAQGALVVDGGRPAAGRNAGAQAATGELVLFLDADVELTNDQLERAVAEFHERELTAATAHIAPIEREPRNIFACDVANLYLDAMQYVVPHAPGFFIMVSREVHDSIGGFDESLVLAEDHDYVARAAKHGKFRVLRSCDIATSMRRIEKEGLVRLAFMYLYCELYVVTGQPIREVPFDYEFASFEPAERSEMRVAFDELRERLSEIAEKVVSVSADGLEGLRELGAGDTEATVFDRLLEELPTDELEQLERYVRARARLARRRSRQAVRRLATAGEAIRQQLMRLSER